MPNYILECCVDSVESVLAAKEGGTDRLELCEAFVNGGISPGQALFEQSSVSGQRRFWIRKLCR